MRQVTRKGLITMAAAGGVLALGGGYANADAGAHGGASNSPGVGSGNAVQVPVDVPVNACGNSVNAVGLLNPVFGNECANKSGPAKHGKGSGHGKGGAHSTGGADNSPGVASGNHISAPVHIPVNACGNTVTIGGLLNPALGNDCANDSEVSTPGKPGPDKPEKPGTVDPPGQPRTVPPVEPDAPAPTVRNGPDAQTLTPAGAEELAQTGADAMDLLIPAGAGMLLAGAVLYRRARSAA